MLIERVTRRNIKSKQVMKSAQESNEVIGAGSYTLVLVGVEGLGHIEDEFEYELDKHPF